MRPSTSTGIADAATEFNAATEVNAAPHPVLSRFGKPACVLCRSGETGKPSSHPHQTQSAQSKHDQAGEPPRPHHMC